MADKEERIWIGTTEKKIQLKQMTRYEAICKIVRAICRAGENECIGDCGSCYLWEVGTEKDYAEAALNALLEDKK